MFDGVHFNHLVDSPPVDFQQSEAHRSDSLHVLSLRNAPVFVLDERATMALHVKPDHFGDILLNKFVLVIPLRRKKERDRENMHNSVA